IGEQNTIEANIYAPNGTLWLKARTSATGAFIGKRVRLGDDTTVALDSIFNSPAGSDKTPPQIWATITPSPNEHGWNSGPVTITFNCIDAESGVASCSPPTTLRTDGSGQLVTGTAIDRAGNSTTTTVTVDVDSTPPTLVLAAPLNGATIAEPTVTISGT